MPHMPLPIADYAIIGDSETGALVGKDGSIDWLCLPRFDSPSCFAALLGDETAGRWQIAPTGEITGCERRYRDGSLVLETDLSTATGTLRIIDVMPEHDDRADVIRRVVGLSGSVEVRMEWIVRFGYGDIVPWVRRCTDADGVEAILAVGGPDAVCLRGNVLPQPQDHKHVAEFTVSADESLSFSMTWFPSHEDVPSRYESEGVLADSERASREWLRQCIYDGQYTEAVHRSLLTLHALTYKPTGAIVAALTTSLPEEFGGSRNWDYRYCWLRDASLTLWAMIATGFRDAAVGWRDWLLRAIAGDPEDMQILYGVGGERRIAEWEVDWLPGYDGAAPVRIGNAAAEQYQADVVGEVMDALQAARQAGIDEDDFSWPLQRAMMRFLEDNWERPDNGIWEIRGERQHFTHSRVMVWVAFDRAVRAVEEHGLSGPVERWRELRDKVHAEVMDKGWDSELGSFTQYYGSGTVDASLLLIPQMRFLPGNHERVTGTIAAVEKALRQGPFVKRYETGDGSSGASVDGLSGAENAFLMCSFWLVSCYALAGRLDDARELFEQLLELRSDLGLLAEEYDGDGHRMAGNFPQAFSHLALIDAAHTLARKGRGQEGGRQMMEQTATSAGRDGDHRPGAAAVATPQPVTQGADSRTPNSSTPNSSTPNSTTQTPAGRSGTEEDT